MSTTVVNVRGLDPDWLHEPGSVYVGWQCRLKSGKYAGKIWHPCHFSTPMGMEPFRLPDQKPTLEARREFILRFLEWLKGPGSQPNIIRKKVRELHGCRLGCWCGEWNDNKRPRKLYCHAVVYAILADYWDGTGLIDDVVREHLDID